MVAAKDDKVTKAPARLALSVPFDFIPVPPLGRVIGDSLRIVFAEGGDVAVGEEEVAPGAVHVHAAGFAEEGDAGLDVVVLVGVVESAIPFAEGRAVPVEIRHIAAKN